MALLVNYEVLVQQNGRWSIHARFEENKKDPAINEGRQLDKLPSVEAVKVVKEVYDTEKEVHNEFVVYKSADMRSGGATKRDGERGGGEHSPPPRSSKSESWLDDSGGDDDIDDDDDDSPRPRRRASARGKKSSTMSMVAVKLLMVILFSIILSGGAAMMADELLGGVRLFGIHFVGNAESNLLIGVFALVFVISATGMSITIMRGANLESSPQRKAPARPAKVAKRAQQKPQQAKKKAAKAPDSKEEAALVSQANEEAQETHAALDDAMKGVEDFKIEQKSPENETKEASDPKKDMDAKATEDKATAERLKTELEKDKEEQGEEKTGKGIVLDAETYGKKETPQPMDLSPQAEKQKAYMMNFLSQALEGGQIDQKKMDSFNKFGINLYLAGACEVLSQKKELDVLSRSKILADTVQVMGFKKSHAASFSDRYEEYLMADSRYMQMFQAGRNAMNIYLTDEAAGPRLLDNALTEWNKPKEKEEQAGPVTVMFTDIAGSTAMTQALGDAGAQQVVRVHNRIVREALSANAGKEVKHTGDGIMASFAKTSDGIDATIHMQLETAKHNVANPDLPLHLKIGLNAGEPIAEDNDLFGTVVQLSARIVDKASADQIFVSEIVRGICAGKSYKFINLGTFPMKGFGEDPTLFEVIWNPDAAEAPAAPSPATAPESGDTAGAGTAESPPATAPESGGDKPDSPPGQPA